MGCLKKADKNLKLLFIRDYKSMHKDNKFFRQMMEHGEEVQEHFTKE